MIILYYSLSLQRLYEKYLFWETYFCDQNQNNILGRLVQICDKLCYVRQRKYMTSITESILDVCGLKMCRTHTVPAS